MGATEHVLSLAGACGAGGGALCKSLSQLAHRAVPNQRKICAQAQ